MNNYLLVGIGGLVGSVSRYWIYLCLAGYSSTYRFPIGTLSINLIGCFLIGLISGFLDRYQPSSQGFQLFLLTGVLGGFTTFSSFGLETINLIKEGNLTHAFLYVAISTFVGIGLVWLGFKLA